MIERAEVSENIVQYFYNWMIGLAQKAAKVNCVIAQPGLIAISPFFHLEIYVHFVDGIVNIYIHIENNFISTDCTKSTLIECDPSRICRVTNDIRQLSSGCQLVE